eukprot:1181359-Prorocentrum_minimum.AAC.2
MLDARPAGGMDGRRSTGGGPASPGNAPAGVATSFLDDEPPASDDATTTVDAFAEMYLDLVLQSVVGALDVSCRPDGWRVITPPKTNIKL